MVTFFRLNPFKSTVAPSLQQSNVLLRDADHQNCVDCMKTYEKRLEKSVLHRLWKHACIISWIIFISYEIAIQCDYLLNSKPLCPYTDSNFHAWYFKICDGVFAGYILICFILLGKIFNSASSGERVPYLIAFNVVCIGTLQNFLELNFKWGGICIDTLGVATPATIWGEWFAGGPILIFICLSLTDKPNLVFNDYFNILSFFVCLLLGFLIIIPQPYWLAVILLVLSCVSFLPVLYLPFYVTSGKFNGILLYFNTFKKVHSNDDEENQNQSKIEEISQLYSKRRSLCIFLALFLPIFSINYFFVSFKLYGYDMGISIFQIFSVLTKGLFSTLCLDIHVDSLKDLQKSLVGEQNKTNARLSFLKYIFHEMRTPLSSINMGISILNDSKNLPESDQYVLEMIESAAIFIEDTLDKSLEMQEVLEGTIKLSYSPFRIKDCITQIMHTFRGDATKKNISLVDNVSPSLVRLKVIGDYYRVEYVIGNLLNNAIKFSAADSTITIEVTGGEPIHRQTVKDNKNTKKSSILQTTFDSVSNNKNESSGLNANLENTPDREYWLLPVTVSIIDQGCGISAEAQKTLFDHFDQTRPENMHSDQGSGLGLPLCKKIIEIHGGTIQIQSIVGQGSIFSFTIPFQVIGNPAASTSTSSRSKVFVPPIPSNVTFTLPKRKRRHGSGKFSFSIVKNASRLMSTTSVSCKKCSTTIENDFHSIIRTTSPDSVFHNFSQKKNCSTPRTSSSYHDIEEAITKHDREIPPSAIPIRVLNTLVVEDVESTRKLFKNLLQKKGIDAVLAEDGQIAVGIVLKDLDAYNLVLMDNVMPNMNGVCATRAIRAAGHKHLIIGVTGNVLTDEIDEFLEAGADLVIKKPLKPLMLEQLLDFIKTNGSLSMYPESKLKYDGSTFIWG